MFDDMYRADLSDACDASALVSCTSDAQCTSPSACVEGVCSVGFALVTSSARYGARGHFDLAKLLDGRYVMAGGCSQYSWGCLYVDASRTFHVPPLTFSHP